MRWLFALYWVWGLPNQLQSCSLQGGEQTLDCLQAKWRLPKGIYWSSCSLLVILRIRESWKFVLISQIDEIADFGKLIKLFNLRRFRKMSGIYHLIFIITFSLVFLLWIESVLNLLLVFFFFFQTTLNQML